MSDCHVSARSGTDPETEVEGESHLRGRAQPIGTASALAVCCGHATRERDVVGAAE